MTESAQVGRSVPRLFGADKVSGAAQYVDDLSRPGMLHGVVLLSPYAHAKITRLDCSAASASPGVACVLTGADFPKRYGGFVADEVVLASDRVRYVGEPIVALAARTLEQAHHALNLIEIEFEELPVMASIEDALAADATPIHEAFESYHRRNRVALPKNVCAQTMIRQGDALSALERCDVVVEGHFNTPAQVHVYLEPCGALAECEPGGRITVWSACQSVFRVQSTLSEILGLPMSKIRAIATLVGGSFGGKSDVTVQPIAAMLALRTRRPVKVVLARNDDFQMMRTRHPARIEMKTGAMADGTIVARWVKLVYDGGAYAEDSSAVLGFALLMARGPYRIEHVHAEGQAVYTNRLRAAGFRGYGNPQVSFAGESQIDELAHRLGRDPIDLRIKNAVHKDDHWVGGQRIESCGLTECLGMLKNVNAGYKPPTLAPGWRTALGVSAFAHICGILSTSAIVRLLEDGSVIVNSGAVDLGEGAETVLSQICAETLKIDVNQIIVAPPDTDSSPYNWSTGGSRTTYMVGQAVLRATEGLRDRVFEQAGKMLECSTRDLELRPGGKVGVKGLPGMETTLHAVSQHAHWVAGGPLIAQSAVMFEGSSDDPKRTEITGNGLGRVGAFIFGAQLVEIAIDDTTGQVKVLRVWAAHDVGRAVNPKGVEGQIAGGVAQGIGYALHEGLVHQDGQPKNASLVDYLLPGSLDLPEVIPFIVEHPEPNGPYGAKGVGEPPIIGIAPAIANAVARTTGHRIRELPISPERVFNALHGN